MGAKEPAPSSFRVPAPDPAPAPVLTVSTRRFGSHRRRQDKRLIKRHSSSSAAAPTAVPGRGLYSRTRARCGRMSRPHSRRRYLIRCRSTADLCSAVVHRPGGSKSGFAGDGPPWITQQGEGSMLHPEGLYASSRTET